MGLILLEVPEAKFTRPEILQHPPIPRQAHGMNPRTFLGKEWWDQERRAAYAVNNYHCWACGTHTADIKWKTGLEAHECYDIDLSRGIMRYRETVALGWPCHSFIHSGRLRILMENGRVSKHVVEEIVTTRMELLRLHNLEPSWMSRALELIVGGMGYYSSLIQVWKEGLVPTVIPPRRHKWRLIVGDRAFDSSGMEVQT